MNNYKQLKVWQKSISLVKDIYSLCEDLPNIEVFTLKKQMHRCVGAIPASIAEGYGRFQNKEFIRALSISRGALYELETQLVISKELNYLKEDEYNRLDAKCTEIEKMLNSFIKSIIQKSEAA